MGFCSNCGSEVKEGLAFCSQCGTKVADATPQNEVPQYSAPQNTSPQGMQGQVPNAYVNNNQGTKKPNNNKVIGMVVVGVVALLAIFALLKIVGLFTTPAYEKPLKYMTEGMEDGSFKKMMKAFPDYMTDPIDEQIDNYYDGETDEFMDMFTDGLENEFGKRIKMSYKVTDKDKLDKDDIESMEEDIEYSSDKKINIKEAYELEVEMTIKGSKGKETEDTEMTVIKIGSKWYLTEDSFGF
ncbi:MAG TPA: zinc ribbon domain-containing protein [Mobilitalea sp.]|nr:zinc ribbon domain-containing protein [Mobilitalea sp.]